MNLQPAIDLIKEFEGCRLEAYKDPVGIPTIGYGTTAGIKMGMRIRKEHAEFLLLNDINTIRLPAVQKMVKVAVTGNEVCALLSLCYNIGVGALSKSTLIRKLNANSPDEAVGV